MLRGQFQAVQPAHPLIVIQAWAWRDDLGEVQVASAKSPVLALALRSIEDSDNVDDPFIEKRAIYLDDEGLLVVSGDGDNGVESFAYADDADVIDRRIGEVKKRAVEILLRREQRSSDQP